MVILNIIWPTFALVALIFVVWVTLVVVRMRHLKTTPPAADDFVTGEAALRYFRPVEMPANNLANLFEMPVLFFALVPLLLITNHANHIQVLLAWLFVAFRAGHSFVHIVARTVQARFLAYLASVVVLTIMWIGFFVDMVMAAQAYSAAMAVAGG